MSEIMSCGTIQIPVPNNNLINDKNGLRPIFNLEVVPICKYQLVKINELELRVRELEIELLNKNSKIQELKRIIGYYKPWWIGEVG